MRVNGLLGFAIMSLGASPATAEEAPGLEWLQGHWCTNVDGARVEELWLAPVDGTTLGMNRTSRDGRMTAFEFLRIADHEGKRAFLAQPGGRPHIAFTLTEHAENYVSFENPGHDFPQRIEYRREGDALNAQTSGPGEDGEVLAFTFDFEPCSEAKANADGVQP